MKEKISELDKLEKYLKDHNIRHERFDDNNNGNGFERHQIIVWQNNEKWDAICHKGSYGYEQGLLEVMGKAVVRNEFDSVEGWLTADEIIRRLEEK